VTSLRIYLLLAGILAAGCSRRTATTSAGVDAREPARPSVRLTALAAERAQRFLREQGRPGGSFLRVSVKQGGPTGFMYDLAFDDHLRPGDLRSTSRGIDVVVDADSWPYLAGAEVDWDEKGGGFRFHNPNAKP
jgi:iron-sulfur cluster assembly accessory protein